MSLRSYCDRRVLFGLRQLSRLKPIGVYPASKLTALLTLGIPLQCMILLLLFLIYRVSSHLASGVSYGEPDMTVSGQPSSSPPSFPINGFLRAKAPAALMGAPFPHPIDVNQTIPYLPLKNKATTTPVKGNLRGSGCLR